MDYHSIFAALVVVTAFAAYINERYFKLPKTIALTIISISISVVINQLAKVFPHMVTPIGTLLSSVDFRSTVLDVMLGYLLFASSLHINSVDLKKNFATIIYLASIGVITSTIFTGFMFWNISMLVQVPLSLASCLIFGALISPTDPIAVMAVFKSTKNVPKNTKARIVGESLLNDAVCILLLVILSRAFSLEQQSHHQIIASIGMVLIKEVVGGLIWGWLVGYIAGKLLSSTNDQEVAILVTVSAASAGYIIAQKLHFSGALTMVVAGLLIGEFSKKEKFSRTTNMALDQFWGAVDGILNAFLFVLIGLESLTIHREQLSLLMAAAGFGIVLLSRFLSMMIPTCFYVLADYKNRYFNWAEVLLLTWGGIRGAISVALALDMPNFPPELVAVTYFLVIFSILFQGASFKWVVNKIYPTYAK